MLKLILASTIILILTSSLSAADYEAIQNKLYGYKKAGNGILSPSGELMVYTVTELNKEKKKYTSTLYLLNLKEGKNPKKISENGERNYSSITWLDNGKIAFLSNNGKGTHVFTQSISQTSPVQVTNNPTHIHKYSFSSDKNMIYFLAEDTLSASEKEKNTIGYFFENDKKHTSLYQYDLIKKRRKKLTFGLTVKTFEYSPEKHMIAFTAASNPYPAYENSTEIYLLDINSRNVKRITSNNIIERQLFWGRQSEDLFFVSSSNQNLEPYYQESIFRIDINTYSIQDMFPDFKYQVISYKLNSAKNRIYFLANKGVTQQLFTLGLYSNTIEELTDLKGVVRDFLIRNNRIIILYSDPTVPEDYFLSDLEAKNFTRLTFSNQPIPENDLPQHFVIEWYSNGGVKIQGILITPAKYDRKSRYPLVVQLHGGPNSSAQLDFPNSWISFTKLLTDMGYMVFQPNYRGSSGYGDAFMREIIGDFFTSGSEDILSGIDFLVDAGITDKNKIAIMGYSAGAHFTNWLITQTDIFKAAISFSGLANWQSFYAQTEVPYLREIWLNMSFHENSETLLEMSPINYVSKVVTPTLFICGENDRRVPSAQNLEMYRGLSHYGIPTKYLLLTNEGHSISDVKSQILKISHELDWLQKYLSP